MAAPIGAMTDKRGPRLYVGLVEWYRVYTDSLSGSLVSAILSAIGYLVFAWILQTKPPDTPYVHLYLTAAFFCVGAATIGSYFAALTCGKHDSRRHQQSRTFPLSPLMPVPN
jgi:hypothetical protein